MNDGFKWVQSDVINLGCWNIPLVHQLVTENEGFPGSAVQCEAWQTSWPANSLCTARVHTDSYYRSIYVSRSSSLFWIASLFRYGSFVAPANFVPHPTNGPGRYPRSWHWHWNMQGLPQVLHASVPTAAGWDGKPGSPLNRHIVPKCSNISKWSLLSSIFWTSKANKSLPMTRVSLTSAHLTRIQRQVLLSNFSPSVEDLDFLCPVAYECTWSLKTHAQHNSSIASLKCQMFEKVYTYLRTWHGERLNPDGNGSMETYGYDWTSHEKSIRHWTSRPFFHAFTFCPTSLLWIKLWPSNTKVRLLGKQAAGLYSDS